jgi:hypothetical protein
MSERTRGPGRPKGTKKEGEKSPKKLLDLLRTKTWAWTCAYYLSEDGEVPLTAYALAKEANKTSQSKNNQSGNYEYDTARWSRWLRGLRGASPATVRSLWKESQNAYFYGPWVDDQDLTPGAGAFVPLWAALQGDENLRTRWKEIPFLTWENWAPRIWENEDTPFPAQLIDPFFLLVSSKDFRSDASLSHFLRRLVSFQDIPGLLAISAAITLARMDGLSKILLFDPSPGEPYSLSPSGRAGVFKALEEINISFPEIECVAQHFGLTIYDCGTLSFGQYCKLSKTPSSARYFRCTHDIETDEDWRAIFGPTIPNDQQ